MSVVENGKIILDKLVMYQGSIVSLVIFITVFGIMMFEWRNFRETIGFPLLLLWVLLFNPILYQYLWNNIMGVTYWRFCWMFFEGIIYCFAIIRAFDLILTKVHHAIGQKSLVTVLVIVCSVFFVLTGQNVYLAKKELQKSPNLYHLPQVAIDVADTLLAMDDNPKVLLPKSLYCYIRQYTNDIELLYGRNIEGYTSGVFDEQLLGVKETLRKSRPEYSYIARVCHLNQVDYIVIAKKKDITLEQYGYEKVAEIDKYQIYENQWGTRHNMQWNIEKCEGNSSTSDYYRITDSYGRQAIIGSGNLDNINLVVEQITNFSSDVAEWIIPEFDESNEAAWRLIIDCNHDINIQHIIFGNIYHDSIRNAINSKLQQYERFIYTCLDGLTQYLNISFAEQNQQMDMLGMEMRVIQSYDNEAVENIRESCAMAFVLEGDGHKILYLPYLSEHIIQNTKQQLQGEQIDLLIVADDNNDALKKKVVDLLDVKQVCDHDTESGSVYSIKVK